MTTSNSPLKHPFDCVSDDVAPHPLVSSGTCRECGWQGSVRRYYGEPLCVSGPSRCWRNRKAIRKTHERGVRTAVGIAPAPRTNGRRR